MNPQAAVGMVMSLFGMTGTVVNEGMMIHRQMNPPVQSQQQLAQMSQACQAQGKQLAVVKINGQQQLVCVKE